MSNSNEITQLKDELKFQKEFLEKINQNLNNDRFIENAPARVIELEREKKSKTENRIKTIENQLAALKEN